MSFMTRDELLNTITTEDVIGIMAKLGTDYKTNKSHSDQLYFRTVCHHGNKRKLYYYQDGKNFVCYTNCGSMQIVDFAMKLFNCDFNKAIKILEKKFNVSNFNVGNFVPHLPQKTSPVSYFAPQ